MAYAEKTQVPVERSEAQIKRLLRDHGASGVLTAHDDREGLATVMFRYPSGGERRRDWVVRLDVPVPGAGDIEVTHLSDGRRRGKVQREARLQQLHRQRWRALFLVVRAKLEVVESGVRDFEQEFLADLVVAGQQTVHQHLQAQLYEAVDSGDVRLLPGGDR